MTRSAPCVVTSSLAIRSERMTDSSKGVSPPEIFKTLRRGLSSPERPFDDTPVSFGCSVEKLLTKKLTGS